MKTLQKLRSLLLATALIAIPAVTLVTAAGCRSVEQTTYRTAGTAHIAVDRAMISWGAYVAKFKPPAAQEIAVKEAYERYQSASLAVINSAQIYSTNKDTKSDFDTALATASVALSELVGLIQEFGVEIVE